MPQVPVEQVHLSQECLCLGSNKGWLWGRGDFDASGWFPVEWSTFLSKISRRGFQGWRLWYIGQLPPNRIPMKNIDCSELDFINFYTLQACVPNYKLSEGAVFILEEYVLLQLPHFHICVDIITRYWGAMRIVFQLNLRIWTNDIIVTSHHIMTRYQVDVLLGSNQHEGLLITQVY